MLAETELRGLGILICLVSTRSSVCPWLNATFILNLREMRITPPRVLSALICCADFANPSSLLLTYPESSIQP